MIYPGQLATLEYEAREYGDRRLATLCALAQGCAVPHSTLLSLGLTDTTRETALQLCEKAYNETWFQ